MRTLTVVVFGLVCVAISGCIVSKDEYDQVSAELVNTQHLVKEANDAHLKIAAENRQLETTLRETQEKLSPVQKRADELEAQLLSSQNAHKKEIAALMKENESLQTQCETAVGDAKKNKRTLEACQLELTAANEKNEGQQGMITRQNLIIKELRKSNANVKQKVTPEPPQ